MTDTQKKLDDGAAAYKRRHPEKTAKDQEDGTKPAHQAGRDAYARRHGTRAGRGA